MFTSVILSQPLLVLVSFLSGMSSLYLVLRFFKKIELTIPKLSKRYFLGIFLWILVSILSIRGGTQKSFLSPSNAIVTSNPLLNQFVLNGIFTTILDYRVEKFPQYQSMNVLEAGKLVRDMIEYPGAVNANELFPLYRKTHNQTNKGKPDIFLIFLESWPTKYIHDEFSPSVSGQEITPEFRKLQKKGVYFPKFFANGGRTSNGLVSLLTGIPDRPGLSVVHTKYSLNNFLGLGTILKKSGYSTHFYYGGELSFENLTPVIKHWGFDNLIDLPVLEEKKKYQKGIWGFNDRDVMEEVLLDIKSKTDRTPRLTVLLTLSTHHPFQIPSEKFQILPPDGDENLFVNSLHYADWALGDFFKEVEKSDLFDNTVFVLVSDHTSHRQLDYFQDRNIPFLIFGKGIPKNTVNHRISSQIDLIPTILGLIDGEHYFSSMGRDILNDPRDGYAYIAFGNIFGWAEKSLFFVDTVNEHNALLFTTEPPYEARGECKNLPVLCTEHHLKSKAFLNLSEYLHSKNMIAPMEALK
ncbi:MAG: LTA synthase family protein [Leptospiraceae bacterium]|nr:LTA synthase family protein [Leptospiraceae bacterium]MCP5512336.1 LTA synthase family protein [Leptospiraceae bacterium]